MRSPSNVFPCSLRSVFLFAEASLLCLCLTTACRTTEKQTEHAAIVHEPDQPGIHNVFDVVPGLISGSAPEGDAGFAVLEQQGVRTIISVDGATPDVATAHRHGLRYVHLPIGYHGIDPERQLEIARVVRDLPGPVYVHCHHGKHRGPTAAASAAVLLGKLSTEAGINFMRAAGTSDNYPGLYACVEDLAPADQATLDAAAADFPEIAPVPGFVKAMSHVDAAYEHLAAIKDAGWQTPAQHPDLVPLSEAAQLENLLRALKDDPQTKEHPADFRAMLNTSWQAASDLETAIAAKRNVEVLSRQLTQVKASCTACHVVYRNKR